MFMLTLFNLLYQRARRLISEETGIPNPGGAQSDHVLELQNHFFRNVCLRQDLV